MSRLHHHRRRGDDEDVCLQVHYHSNELKLFVTNETEIKKFVIWCVTDVEKQWNAPLTDVE